jgi:hypothetical protein
VWSLTWIASLLQSASLRGGGTFTRYSLEIGFWLQAVSIGVVVIGTILVVTHRTEAHEKGSAGLGPNTMNRSAGSSVDH